MIIVERPPAEHAERAARALHRESNGRALGATVLHVIVFVQTWGDAPRLWRTLGVIVLATAANAWLSRVGPRRMTVGRVEGLRIVLNTVHAVSIGVVTHWVLATWFFFPFVAINAPNLDRHGSLRVTAYVFFVSGVALWNGVALTLPASFSLFALVCYSVAKGRTHTIRQMLDESDEHRRALESARRELSRANEQIQNDLVVLQKKELELRQAQKLEAVGRLASGIAHEINTPVQFVGDSVQFIRSGIEDLMCAFGTYRAVLKDISPEAADAARRADEEADVDYLIENLPLAAVRAQEGLERVAVIVRSMKEFAHPDQAMKNLTDLNRAVQATVTIACNEYKYVADLRTEFGDLPQVPCFVGELNQVILNLLVNAAHAIGDVHAKTGKKGTIVVRTFVEGEDVVLQVSDAGTGIPESAREHLFEPFFTTKEVGRGTGQGLAIARAVVTRHGGSISFETELGEGTTFTIRLPISDDAAAGLGVVAA